MSTPIVTITAYPAEVHTSNVAAGTARLWFEVRQTNSAVTSELIALRDNVLKHVAVFGGCDWSKVDEDFNILSLSCEVPFTYACAIIQVCVKRLTTANACYVAVHIKPEFHKYFGEALPALSWSVTLVTSGYEAVELAENLAYKYHDGQMYGNEPYTSHLKAVRYNYTSLVSRWDEKDKHLFYVLTWLHDILEDTAIQPQIVVENFGADVYSLLEMLNVNNYSSRKDYLRAVAASSLTATVKLADVEANLAASEASNDQKRIKKYSKYKEILLNYMP